MWIGTEENQLDMESIKSAGILYDQLSISTPASINIITFPEEEWLKVKDMFSLPDVDLIPTNLSEVVFYTKSPEQKVDNSPRVAIHSWNGKMKEEFIEMTERLLLPLFDKKIVVTVPHGMFSTENTNPNEFHIKIGSQMDKPNAEIVDKPLTYWGIKIDCPDYFHSPSGKGIEIIESDGFCVAELLDNTLFIHHDLIHFGEEDAIERQLAILQKIYENVITIRSDPKEYEKIKQEREIKSFCKILNQSGNKKLSNAIKMIDKLDRQVEEYRGYLVTSHRDLIGYLKERNYLEKHGTSVTEAEVKKQWEELKHIKEVSNVSIGSSSNLEFDVDKIHIPYEEETYEVGPFHVSINFPNAIISIISTGVKGKRDGKAHPHVNSNGTVCFGNLHEAVTSALTNYEFLVIINLILELLHNYTSSDAYEPLIYFKKVKNGKK